MSSQRTVIMAAAAIVYAAILQATKANGQGAGLLANVHRARPVQAAMEGGNEASQEAETTPVMSRLLADLPGKEVVMITVTYPPGRSGAVHRHNAHGFIYVLEGSVVMGVNGRQPVTLAPGQTFYEGPNDIHTVGRNASKTRPARFLVFLIKDEDAPISVPVK